MPRGGKRAGAGRKKFTVEEIYNKTYIKKLERLQARAGELEFSTLRKISFENFKNQYETAVKLSKNHIKPAEFVNDILKKKRERTRKQAYAQAKNVREHIKKAKLDAAQGQPLSALDQIFSTLNEDDFTYSTLYQGSANIAFLEQLVFEGGNKYGEVFGS